MNVNYNTPWLGSRRAGLSLCEVIVSLALLGMLLVSLLLASARHARQMQRASHSLEAVQATDTLLQSWYATGEGIPVQSSGELAVSEEKVFYWRTAPVSHSAVESSTLDVQKLGLTVVRLEVFASPEAATAPLAWVELAVATPPATE